MVKTNLTSTTALASSARLDSDNELPKVFNADKGHTGISAVSSQPAFASAAIGMGWQLAVVVLLPIVGGYKLDQIHLARYGQYYGGLPFWTLLGLVLAMVGSLLVIRHALTQFGNFNVTTANVSKDTHPEAVHGTSGITKTTRTAQNKHRLQPDTKIAKDGTS